MVRTRRTATDSPMASAHDLERLEAARRAASRNSAEPKEDHEEHAQESDAKPAAAKKVNKRKAAPKPRKAPVKRATRTRQLAEGDDKISDGDADDSTTDAEVDARRAPRTDVNGNQDSHSRSRRSPSQQDEHPREHSSVQVIVSSTLPAQSSHDSTPQRRPAHRATPSNATASVPKDRSKRKRKENNDESPAKRSRLVEPRSDSERSAHYEGGDMVIVLDSDKKDKKSETRKRMTAHRTAHARKGPSTDRKTSADDTDAGKIHDEDTEPQTQGETSDGEDTIAVNQAGDTGNDRSITVSTPNKANPATPSHGSWSSKFSLSSIGGLFATPLNVFRRSATRDPIPDFTQPQNEDKNASSPARDDSMTSVARPLFSAQKPRKTPKKVTKAKRQEAINHQNDLERRKVATSAIASASMSAEEIEAEIQRRVQAALDEIKEQSPKSAKRKRVDGPGSTPHAKKTSRNSLAGPSTPVERNDVEAERQAAELVPTQANEPRTPPTKPMFHVPTPSSGRNSSFGLNYTDGDSDDDLESEMPPSKRVKTVSFAPRTESLTTPPHGSELAKTQARRPPGTDWRHGQMFREGPLRSVLKTTGYIPPWQPAQAAGVDDADIYENYTPHAIREGIPDHLFNFSGSFSLPEDTFYDSDSDDGEFEPSKLDAGSTPMPKKTIDRPVAQTSPTEEAPPAAPHPAFATLPSPASSARTNGSQPDALSAARAKATQFTPKQPSRLRESTNMPAAAKGPGTLAASSQAAPPSQSAVPASMQSQPLSDLLKENIDPEVLSELAKITSAPEGRRQLEQAGMKPLRERFAEQDGIDKEVLDHLNKSFPQFWQSIGSTVKQQIKDGVENWKPAHSTGVGF